MLPFKTDAGEEILLIHDPENKTFWASQKQMAIMFDVTVPTINEHVQDIESQLSEAPTLRDFHIVQNEGKRKVQRSIRHYNHEMILMVGFRCHSDKALRYQKWAVDVLYLQLMREKRDLEKEAYKNLIRTMSFAVDYESNSKDIRRNFAIMQDMMHYAAAGLSAAGIIIHRADHRKDHMGLTSFAGKEPVKKEVTVAKNYLYEQELDHQLKIATGFMLSIEIAATGYKKYPYTQEALLQELKEYLLKYHQQVWQQGYSPYSRNQANAHAHREYELFREVLRESLSQIASGQPFLEDGLTSEDEE
jgi:hypothetical protein